MTSYQTRMVRCEFLLPKELLDRIKEHAITHQTTLSSMIRDILKSYDETDHDH